jgi:uncharacterized protein (TIGR00255 family)
MLKSMTGFGRSEILKGDFRINVEIKSVNHRYLDMNIRLPRQLNAFEANIRSVLKEYIQRGKVDVFINCEDYSQGHLHLNYNQTLAEEYMRILQQIQQNFPVTEDITVSRLASMPEVITMEKVEADEDELQMLIEQAVREAADKFVQSRCVEGEQLKRDLYQKLENMLEWVEEIKQRMPKVLDEYQSKLTAKVKEMLEDRTLEESRILTEVALFADKVCVDEEIVRLQTHIKSMEASLQKGGSIGRNLDFVAQEMNREANTILSKSNDLKTSDVAIWLKTEIEKVREQIQNIE